MNRNRKLSDKKKKTQPKMLKRIQYKSDCAVNNEPAYRKGKCNCGTVAKIK